MENFDDLSKLLANRGLVKLEGIVPAQKARDACALVLDLAREHGVYSAGRWMKSTSRFGYPKPFRNALNALNRAMEFPNLIDDRLVLMIERLVGQPVTPLSPGQQILFSLPIEDDWSVPSDAWHIDLPKIGENASPGLQAFTFLDDVEVGGGATLVLAGSHLLFNNTADLSSSELKRHLRKEDYFRSFFDSSRPPFTNLAETRNSVQGVELEVVELTGNIGDLYLMDLRMLHTAAPNCSDKARQMLTCRFPRATIAAKYANTNLVM
jgi:ectoine hydroxylase-related dioxygenase (phytanoyl-CoA dioxygenase family)